MHADSPTGNMSYKIYVKPFPKIMKYVNESSDKYLISWVQICAILEHELWKSFKIVVHKNETYFKNYEECS